MEMKTVVVRYGEIALKSEPVRRSFERRLIDNIKLSLRGLDYEVKKERGRIFVDTKSVGTTVQRLSKVPGIVSVSPSIRVDANIDSICSAAVEIVGKVLSRGMSFAIRTSRVGEHPFSSKEVNERVGSIVLRKVKGVRVDLSNPEREIFVEVRGRDARLFTETKHGVGGLPVGTQGKIVALFSGGLNSWVATYLMMKRGCVALPLFPDPRPVSNHQMYKLATNAARRLALFYPKLELCVFPSDKILRALKKVAPDFAYCVHKRVMLRAAGVIAKRIGADAIATDESPTQIARLGLANLRVMDEACEPPVLRPLAGMDENDIVQTAHDAELLDESAKPIGGLTPPSRLTPLRIEAVREIERNLKIDELLEEALSKIKILGVGRSWI